MTGRIVWPRWVRELHQRLARDFQFSMVIYFGLLAMLSIGSMQVFRMVRGEWLGALVNLSIVLAIGAVVVYAWRSGETRRAGFLFAMVTVIACVGSGMVFNRTGLFWGYVILWINFVLTGRRAALGLNILMIIGLAWTSELFQETIELLVYVVTCGLVCTFGYLFAAQLARQQRELEAMAELDPLTGLGNRRRMRQSLAEVIERAASSGTPAALMLIDLDHFKRLNDECGHDAGDQALRNFASAMNARIRKTDECFRFGGEEFLLLLPNTNREQAAQLAVMLHGALSGTLTGARGPLHFSAGVASLRPGEDWESWVKRADAALYRAKRAGRNRIELAQEQTAGPRQGDQAPLLST